MSNKSDGNKVEIECCELLYKCGFWVHQLTQNSAGQPADILAVKNGKAYLIDAKNCTHGRFELRRIEENQKSSMEKWQSKGNLPALFFIKLHDDIYVAQYNTLMRLKHYGYKSITSTDCAENGIIPVERWLVECN